VPDIAAESRASEIKIPYISPSASNESSVRLAQSAFDVRINVDLDFTYDHRPNAGYNQPWRRSPGHWPSASHLSPTGDGAATTLAELTQDVLSLACIGRTLRD
jgi:hypothetical protein